MWFAAVWAMTSDKQGVSALGLKRVLEVGSTQTAWAMLHRYRSAMVRPGRDRLSGTVEADETFLGGPEPGVPGRGALGKIPVEVAVERRDKGFGRCRRQVIGDASTATLRAFLLGCVEPGSVVLTDGFQSYPSACGTDYVHRPTSISGSRHQAHELRPGVHRVASLAKRWIEATHQGAVKPALVPTYLDEFCFRFNRRHSRARGMLFHRLLEQAVQSAPRTYRSPVAEPGSARRTMPVPPLNKRVHCDSVARPVLDRPCGQPLSRDDEHLLHSDGEAFMRLSVGRAVR